MVIFPVRRWKVCEVAHPVVRLFHTQHALDSFVYVGYSIYVRATNSNPQMGDVVELDNRLKMLALSLDQESPV